MVLKRKEMKREEVTFNSDYFSRPAYKMAGGGRGVAQGGKA